MKKALASMALGALCACSSTPTFSPPTGTATPVTPIPAAYVSETCSQPNDACSPAGGLVEILGGPAITANVAQPWAVAFDSKGDAFVANENIGQSTGFVNVYAAGATTLLRTIGELPGSPHALAFDGADNVYVVGSYKYGCCQLVGFISVYTPHGKLLRKLTGVSPFAGRPAFDAAGNLYVPNFSTFPGWVSVYAPGATQPSRSINAGIGFPKQLAFDRKGELFVLNNTFDNGSNVTVYDPASGKLLRTISDGLTSAYGMALDSQGNLYVANVKTKGAPSGVTVYAPGSTKVARTIVAGLRDPVSVTVDGSDNLLVANSPTHRASFVSVYPLGAMSPSQTFRLREGPTEIVATP
jgi:DNA-binding beta-propeller fold protein YncE